MRLIAPARPEVNCTAQEKVPSRLAMAARSAQSGAFQAAQLCFSGVSRRCAAAPWRSVGTLAAAVDSLAAAAGARPAAAAAATPSVEQRFAVYHWDTGRYHEYVVDISSCGPTVVDVLLKIRSKQDPRLAVGVGCLRGRCGACACTIDGRNAMACQARVGPQPGREVRIKSITAPLVAAAADPS
ncbi:hypothetical protein ABPG75_000557 [Micractinium tetrahymenae]